MYGIKLNSKKSSQLESVKFYEVLPKTQEVKKPIKLESVKLHKVLHKTKRGKANKAIVRKAPQHKR